MKRMLLLLIVSLLAVSLAFSQMGPAGGKGWGPRHYDPATEVTLKGTIENVTHPTGKNGTPGTHLSLKSDRGTFDVHVGPEVYVSSQQFSFTKGDAIEVIGSEVNISGHDAIIARQITRGDKVLTLRNQSGFPLWSRVAASTK